MQTSRAGLNRDVRGAPLYSACAAFGTAAARQASDKQLAMMALIETPPLYLFFGYGDLRVALGHSPLFGPALRRRLKLCRNQNLQFVVARGREHVKTLRHDV